MSRKIRILVVDASASGRRLVTQALSSEPTFDVVGSAPNARIVLAKVKEVYPDLITLQMGMPDGETTSTLAALHKAWPRLPVVTSDARTEQKVRETLIPRIKKTLEHGRTPASSEEPPKQSPRSRPDVLVIGVSTGGPNALAELLREFPADFPIPVLIVQHMPPLFTGLLAERLDKICRIRVSQGTAHEAIGPGRVWIAPGDVHMSLQRDGLQVRIQLDARPPENSCRPSVDVLFRTAAEVYGSHVLATIMTGMGQDGFLGCDRIHAAGGQIFVQDEASSVVWGMPRSVARAGLADKILPLHRLGIEIVRFVCGHASDLSERPMPQGRVEGN